MIRRILPVAVLAVGATAALGLTTLSPMPIPRYTQVMPPQDTRIVCTATGDGQLLADGDGALALTGGDAPAEDLEAPIVREVEEAVALRGHSPHGGILADGVWSPCQAPATEGFVGFPEAASAELRLTNLDSTDAAVDLRLFGPDGEIEALGARGIALAPGETRPVAVSVLAQGVDGPVGVTWATSRGRVTAVGVTTGEIRHVVPSATLRPGATLPGVGAGGKPTLVLTNAGEDRVDATVTFHSPTSAYTPEGGADLSVPPQSSIVVDLSAGTAGEAGAMSVESTGDLGIAMLSGSGERRGAVVDTVAGSALTGVVPSGAVLQLTNPGEVVAAAVIHVDAAVQEVRVEPGATSTITLEGSEPSPVRVDSDQPLVAAAVTEEGVAIVPLGAATAAEVEPLDAELVPTLR